MMPFRIKHKESGNETTVVHIDYDDGVAVYHTANENGFDILTVQVLWDNYEYIGLEPLVIQK